MKSKDKKGIIVTILLSILTLNLAAQDKNTFLLKTTAKEGFTGDGIKSATAKLIDRQTSDTIATASPSFYMAINGNKQALVAELTFEIPKRAGNYMIEATAPGYDTVYQYVNLDAIGKREYEKILPDLIFYKPSTTLKEVSVTATKVKFYNNGDTLIYNADAFALPEGSMLDVLISQLPGVELKPGGEIYVNGKKVESLLLDGKQFFQGNRNIMLNNLGAYTVKTVEVYDKWGERSILAGRNTGDTEYVMDVRLKKEYLSGFTGNLEAGYGTADRYLGRLFSLWYTSRSRLALIGNINNLNDSRTPGENQGWAASQIPGDLRTKLLALDYLLTHDDGKKWEFNGNTSVRHSRNHNLASTFKTNFLNEGNNYQDSYLNSLSHNLKIRTENGFKWRPEHQYYSLSQYLEYSDNRFNSDNLSGTFQENIDEMTESLLNQIYTGGITSFKDITINSSLQQTLSSSKTLDVGGNLNSSFLIPHTPDNLSIDIDGGYKNTDYYDFNSYKINFMQSGNHDYRYYYTDNRPDRNWNISIAPGYLYNLSSEGSIYFYPKWVHTSTVKDSYLYELDRLSDSGEFGILPSDYLSGLDKDQTYLSSETSDVVTVGINYLDQYNIGKGSIRWQIIGALRHRWRRFDYQQGEFSENLMRRSTDFEIRYSYIQYRTGQHSFKLNYDRTIDLVPMDRMVDVPNTRNPLNIYLGNSDLKNSAKNDLSFEWNVSSNKRPSWRNSLKLRYTLFENSLTSGYSFNSETGVRTYKMFNVDGNYQLSAEDNFYKEFGSKKQFDITSSTGLNYEKASDMTAVDNMDFQKSTVGNFSLSESLRLGWRVGRLNLGANGSVSWRKTKSERESFADFSAITAQYGLSLKLNLPFNFSLSTDYNFYTRTGFSEASLNKTDMVWNARLSYALKGGNWLFMVDGFDLLHQLTNVTYNVNALGRTETYRNSLPRYVLLHIQYKFMIKPKKKARP